jgi:hypothetical protein
MEGVGRWRWTWNRAGQRGRCYPRHDKLIDGYLFSVREYGRRNAEFGRLWAIEREPYMEETNCEVLALSSVPLLFTWADGAKRIAQACHPEPRKEAEGLYWIRADSTGGTGHNFAA